MLPEESILQGMKIILTSEGGEVGAAGVSMDRLVETIAAREGSR